MHLWDTRDEPPGTVKRPTEQLALRGLFRQSRLIQKKGVLINLSPLHLTALQLEYHAMSKPPYPDNVYTWIAARMHGIPPLQVKALLDECSFVVLLREALGLPPLNMQWTLEPVVVKRAA